MKEKIPAIAIYDIGKTNKKLHVFNQDYELVYERIENLPETVDEDGFPCEDLAALTGFIKSSFQQLLLMEQFDIHAVNFSAYGASLVYVDEDGIPIGALQNYLKPFPVDLQERFYKENGGREIFSRETASPVLGSLNSGLQLYRTKYEHPEVVKKLRWALHLPGYLSFVFTGNACSEITSIGCHTGLWDFTKNEYHAWLTNEGLLDKLAPIVRASETISVDHIHVGTGLHDSSAALIPYLMGIPEPFLLISTGTWCISLQPFNNVPLSAEELKNDCLCYLSFQGNPVKASRIFSGHEHDEQVKLLSNYFQQPSDHYKNIQFDKDLARQVIKLNLGSPSFNPFHNSNELQQSPFRHRALKDFKDFSEAYHQLLFDLAVLQQQSSQWVLNGAEVNDIYIDGGFSNNEIFMQLLAYVFRGKKVYAAALPQSSSLGAAMVIHSAWNSNKINNNLLRLKYYPFPEELL